MLFRSAAISRVHQLSSGIPRVINVLCDRALLGAFSQSKQIVSWEIVGQAGKEVLNELPSNFRLLLLRWFKFAGIALITLLVPLIAYVALNNYQAEQTGTMDGINQVQPDTLGDEAQAALSGNVLTTAPSIQASDVVKANSFDLTYRLGVPLKSQ